MIPSEGEQFNFDKSVSNAHLLAKGWHLDNHQHSNPFECHVFYVRDFRHLSLNLFTVNKTDFSKVLTTGTPMGELSYSIAQSIIPTSTGGIDPSNTKMLAASLALYVKHTGAYIIWLKHSNPADRLHALINIYPSAGGDSVLRPAIINSIDSFLPPNDILEFTRQLKDMDTKNHPEWFT